MRVLIAVGVDGEGGESLTTSYSNLGSFAPVTVHYQVIKDWYSVLRICRNYKMIKFQFILIYATKLFPLEISAESRTHCTILIISEACE